MLTGDCYNPVFKMDSFLFYVVYFSGVLILSIRLGDIDLWSVQFVILYSMCLMQEILFLELWWTLKQM